MAPLVVIVIVLVLVAVVVAVVISRRREPDTLGSFQRQIDALSPEARRPVVDQVQRFEQDDQDDGNDGHSHGS